MLIAHLPSGYLLGRGVGARGTVMAAALLGSVAPDFDMIWFHFVDHGRVLHHEYWTHLPAFWLGIALTLLPLLYWRASRLFAPAAAFLAGVFLHLILDTLVGGIMWLWPFDDRLLTLAVVPARYDNWVLSFILHWSFLAELIIIALALFAWRRDTAWRRMASGHVATDRNAR
ncbi:MAG: metal-dependent hydrolase [Paracoccus sp. (in: a-proteobacteria)]